MTVQGRFPVHDLVEIGVEIPAGDYTTVAGMVLAALGRIPDQPGDTALIDGWEATGLGVDDRAIARVRLCRRSPEGDEPEA